MRSRSPSCCSSTPRRRRGAPTARSRRRTTFERLSAAPWRAAGKRTNGGVRRGHSWWGEADRVGCSGPSAGRQAGADLVALHGGSVHNRRVELPEFYGSWFGAFPDAHVEVHDLSFLDGVAVEEGTFTGTQNAVLHSPTGDIPPTGRAVRLEYIQVLRFRDGKHVSFNLMFDRLLMLEQLGLIPAPAG